MLRSQCSLILILVGVLCCTGEIHHNKAEISHLSWNILAPIWEDIAGKKLFGDAWDLNLLNADTRIELIVSHITDVDADIIMLQEVQGDVYEKLKKKLPRRYKAVAFAPNENNYWEEYLPNGTAYVENGVATFFKWRKLSLVAHNTFLTSPDGSVGLASVLRPRRSGYLGTTVSNARANPIVLINCHLEAGISENEIKSRIGQTSVIMKEATRISTEIKSRFPTTNPVVIITGDINSGNLFPAFDNFLNNGYLNAMLEKNISINTFFYPIPIPIPGYGLRNGVPIDHTFIREADKKAGLIEFSSLEIPDINSDLLKEENYIEKLILLLSNDLRRHKVRGFGNVIRHLSETESFSNLLKIRKDGNEYDTNINRVLRMGSDHLPVLIKFGFKF